VNRRAPPPSYVGAADRAVLALGTAERGALRRARDEEHAERLGYTGRDAGPAGMPGPPAVIHAPGGELVEKLLPMGATVFDREWRKLPDESMYLPTVDPRNPFKFTVGSYSVPKGTFLLLEHYEFRVMLPDPISPHDYRYAEDGRFAGSLGFDINVNSSERGGDVSYQLDPQPIPTALEQFEPTVAPVTRGGRGATTARFQRVAASSFAATAGIGTSLSAPRRRPMGPAGRAFCWAIEPERILSIVCAVYRRVSTPLAGVYASASGHLISAEVATTLLNRTRLR
jgi:hypothetical protein